MRIISGMFRGKKLISPLNLNIRPTLDRVKETLFNCINFKILNSTFLDLFAGSGAIGIEAVSRKASEVVFVEKDKENLKGLQNNLKLINCNSVVFNLDFVTALNQLKNKKFDFIYLDPPYDSNYYAVALETIDKLGILNKSGYVICEHDNILDVTQTENFIITKVKTIGSVSLSFFSYKGNL